MTVIEELMAIVRAQQQTIEFLTSKLEETNAKLGETNAKLEKANARIAELEEQLHKDSHNSSKPPSYYALSEKRGKQAMDEIGFLSSYRGIVVHDFWASYFKATGAEHAMCCAHLLRELTSVFENHPEQTWAKEPYCELLSKYRAADYYNQHPEIESWQHYMECLKRNYDQILEKGAVQNPLPEKASGKRGRAKRGKIRALIDRLRTYKGEVCRFADNSIAPFTNNQAERDLRMVRMKSKVIGTFRAEQGAIDFLLLKSFTSTAAKARIAAFDALFSLFCGQLALGTE